MLHLPINAVTSEQRKALLPKPAQARPNARARRTGTLLRRLNPHNGPDVLRTRHRKAEVTVDTVPRERVRLHDGSTVTIRPIRPADASLIADAFHRLSDASRHNRFLGGKSTLSPAELHRFTVVDHRDHEALIAISTADHRAVGVARYIRLPNSHRRAEIAVTVIDEWHRRGLGRVLVDRLTDRARAEGIGAFTALIANHNAAALALLRGFRGHAEIVECGFGTTEYALDLASPHAHALAAQKMNARAARLTASHCP